MCRLQHHVETLLCVLVVWNRESAGAEDEKMAKLMKSFFGAVTSPLKSLGTESSEAPVALDVPQVELPCSTESGEEDEDSFEDYNYGGVPQPVLVPSKRGTLSKWTNYLLGWQERYVIVAEGIMSYFKSEVDTNFGCRGSVSLQKATIAVRLAHDTHTNTCSQRVGREDCGEVGCVD